MGNGFGLHAGMNRFSQDTSAEDSGFFVGLLCWMVASCPSLLVGSGDRAQKECLGGCLFAYLLVILLFVLHPSSANQGSIH